jgi:hypothetical protein
MLTPFPSGFQFGSGDIPVRTAFPQHGTQVLPKLFDGRPAKKPVAIVDLKYNQTRFKDDDMWDHRIVLGVRILGDVEILLNLASRIGKVQWAPTPVRYSFVASMLSVLIVTRRQ